MQLVRERRASKGGGEEEKGINYKREGWELTKRGLPDNNIPLMECITIKLRSAVVALLLA